MTIQIALSIFILSMLVSFIYTVRVNYKRRKQKIRLSNSEVFSIFIRYIKLAFTLKVLKGLAITTLKIPLIILKNRKLKDLLYLFFTLSMLSLFFIESVNQYDSISSLVFGVLCLIGFCWMFLLLWELFKTKNSGLKIYVFTISVLFLLILLFVSLVLFEKYKNIQTNNEESLYSAIGLSIFCIALLLMFLKRILDQGNLMITLFGGLCVYILFLMFTTSGLGMYLTAKDPITYPKDQLIVGNTTSFASYMLSYSYKGANALLQYPAVVVETTKEDVTKIKPIPQYLYLSYIGGLFLSLAVFAFFVSYSVSIYILKHSNKGDYESFINQKTIMSEYQKFLKRKLKIILYTFLVEINKREIIQETPSIESGGNDVNLMSNKKDYLEKFPMGNNETQNDSASSTIREEALKQALDIRKFEIELYWKRATYFWTFIGATFAGYFLVLSRSDTIKNSETVLFLLACLGFMFSFSWFLVNKGSKFWQNNWERHVDALEDQIMGPLYKSVIKQDTNYKLLERIYKEANFSVSKVNQILSFYLMIVWILIGGHSILTVFIQPDGSILEYMPSSSILVIGIVTVAFSVFLLKYSKSGHPTQQEIISFQVRPHPLKEQEDNIITNEHKKVENGIYVSSNDNKDA